jgi:hypothetical protein
MNQGTFKDPPCGTGSKKERKSKEKGSVPDKFVFQFGPKSIKIQVQQLINKNDRENNEKLCQQAPKMEQQSMLKPFKNQCNNWYRQR